MYITFSIYLESHDEIYIFLIYDTLRYIQVQTSPVEVRAKRDSLNALDADILARQSEVARTSPAVKKMNSDEERTNLLPKQDNS